MVRESEIREGELAVDMPAPRDAGLVFIGRIRTPWKSRLETPRQGRHDGPVCRLEIFEPWVPAIKGVDFYSNLEVIYWLHQSRRDLVLQSPKNNGKPAARFRCARQCGRTRSRPRSSSWSASRATSSWCAVSIASTRRRSSTSSPTAANSRRWRRRSRGILRRSSCHPALAPRGAPPNEIPRARVANPAPPSAWSHCPPAP